MIASLIGPISVQANQGNQGFQGILPTNEYYGQQGILGRQAPYQGFQGLGGPNTGSMPLAGPQGWYGFAGPGTNGIGSGSVVIPLVLGSAGAYTISNTVNFGSPVTAMFINGFSSSDANALGQFKVAQTGLAAESFGPPPSPTWTVAMQYYQSLEYILGTNNTYTTTDTSGWVDIQGPLINMTGVDQTNHSFPEDVYIYGPGYIAGVDAYSLTISWTVTGTNQSIVGYITPVVNQLDSPGTSDVTTSGGSVQYEFSSLPGNAVYFMYTRLDSGPQPSGQDDVVIAFTITVSQQANQGNSGGVSQNQSFTVYYLTM
jgi:hypothetical protein